MKSRRRNNTLGRVFLKMLQAVAVVVLVVLIFIVVRKIYFQVQDERNINKGVMALRSEVEELNQENNDLNKLIKYFNSTEFQEKEIKERLNLVKEGERVVFVQEGRDNKQSKTLIDEQKANNVTTVHANYYYWWKYFFGR